jgi:hypothetical protein
LKKKYDPLWEIVGEKVCLQGGESRKAVACPQCHVAVDLPSDVRVGERFSCGLCSALCEVAQSVLVADDGAPETVARLAK